MRVFAAPRERRQASISAHGAERAAIALGACVLLATFANLAVLWSNVQVGTPQWELAVTSQTFERVPMILFGLLLVGLGGVYGKSVLAVRFAAVTCLVVTVLVAGLAALYGLAVVQAYSTIPVLVRGAFKASAAKNAVTTAAFALTSAYMGVVLWRCVRRAPSSKE